MNLHVELQSKLFFQALILRPKLSLRLGCISSDEANCSQLRAEHALKENLCSNTNDEVPVCEYK